MLFLFCPPQLSLHTTRYLLWIILFLMSFNKECYSSFTNLAEIITKDNVLSLGWKIPVAGHSNVLLLGYCNCS